MCLSFCPRPQLQIFLWRLHCEHTTSSGAALVFAACALRCDRFDIEAGSGRGCTISASLYLISFRLNRFCCLCLASPHRSRLCLAQSMPTSTGWTSPKSTAAARSFSARPASFQSSSTASLHSLLAPRSPIFVHPWPAALARPAATRTGRFCPVLACLFPTKMSKRNLRKS